MSAVKFRELTVALPASCNQGKIGIVTVTYNSEFVLPDFLDSLDRQDYVHYVLIVVDNASTDRTLTVLRERPGRDQIVIANSSNLGTAAGNNQGIRAAIEAGCEYVLLLNNDVVLDQQMLSCLLRGLSEHACSMAVPMMYFQEPRDVIWAAGGGFRPNSGFRIYHGHYGERDSPQSSLAARIEYAPTCCVLIRREVFSKVGLMDERYFVYSDDVDFMYRARAAGEPMYFIPEAKLWHKVNGLTGGAESDFSYFFAARGRALFLYKHFNRATAFLWTTFHAVFDLFRAVFRRSFRHGRAVKWRGMKEGKKVALDDQA